jgi:hypothetical protein
MTRILSLAGLFAAIGLATASPALAHHSFAMFDFGKVVTLKGTVKEFQWSNPHVILWVETDASASEAATLWSAELTSPGNLTRNGWTRTSLKPGDKIELEVNPLRDGKHGGGFHKATLVETGQVFSNAGPGPAK